MKYKLTFFCAGWSLTVCYVHQVIFAL